MNKLGLFVTSLFICLIFTVAAGAGAAADNDKQQSGNPVPNSRFVDNGNGTISDKLTGLIWLKNADCFSLQNWDDAILLAGKLFNGQCGLKDGSRVGQWRLPDSDELSSLFNKQQSNSADWLNLQGFSKVQPDLYWSSTGSDVSSNIAMCADMHRGGVFKSGTSFSYHVLPVRGGEQTN